ncbi:uncharacterized protein PV09_03127 [Verruconis gallopava]|uniref:NmrA-like domain-containing protein n=1 Tax=Verruconis gallopava TaxID=253628 RepID=A0A0D2AHA3_9PEZI|nr:uncharacterized protein PV09_03127 [Verruconis gallopava]KIW05935.1 hypothetical protein PV09_03127 [Verruconis gallopava]
MSKNVLIFGATGQQGGSTVMALLESPQADSFTILGVTRNASSASAKKLEARGVKIVQGDMNDVPAIFAEAEKVAGGKIWGVFAVQLPPVGSKNATAIEEAHGKAVVDGALAHGVKHFVYTSVERGGDDKSYDNPTNVPHFISKHNIEHHLVDKAGDKMGWTILRPVAFMNNLQPGWAGKIFPTAWKIGLTRPLQLIAGSDIGHFGAQALIDPEKYNHRGIGLAGDELTFEEGDRIFKEQFGYSMPLTFEFLIRLLFWFVPDVGLMFKWFESDGYAVDIGKLRAEHPGLKTWREFLQEQSGFEVKKRA